MKKFNDYSDEEVEIDIQDISKLSEEISIIDKFDFSDIESEFSELLNLNEAEAPKTKFKYEISANLAKIRKAQKFMIDVAQLLTEMQVDIQKLKVNAERFKKNSPPVVDKIDLYLEKMFLKLKSETKDDKPNHLMHYADALRVALEDLQALKYRRDTDY
jgi:hypothetical protein